MLACIRHHTTLQSPSLASSLKPQASSLRTLSTMPAERTRRARLAKGSKYKDLQEFKDAVRDYALEEAFELKVQKSNSKWAILVCKNKECPFRARAHVCKDNPGTVEVSVFVPGHVCAGLAASERDSTNKHSYLVDLINSCMVVDQSTTDAQIVTQLKRQFGKDVPQQSASKARLAILGSNADSQRAEFQQIEDWLAKVKQMDPDAHTAHLPVEGKFSRAFVCSGAARAAWSQCKPFVAVDGTWTKNRYGMILLLAAAMDANSSLIILAWALVSTESQVTWEWFLRMLVFACPSIGDAKTTIISDRQKGLLNAINEVLPDATEGYCCWHLAENVKTHFGVQIRKQFWGLVYAETKKKFDGLFAALKLANKAAAHYLSNAQLPHEHWASYAFPGRRFDHVTSNLSEISNSALRVQRELPPLQLMAGIYNYQMRVFYERKQEAAIWMQILAPHPHELFVAALQRARKMTCIPADNLSGLVIGETGDQYEVDLAADPKTQLSFCPCGVPSLMLLPCAHLCALALTLKVAPVLYAYGYWTRATWRATYSKAYVAVSTDGLTSNNVEVPSAKTKKGRPQKARKEAGQGPSSTPSSSKNTSPSVSFCSSCGEPDHTARHCKAYYEAALH
ncbi:hypothetical protein CF336_g8641 [Tilletia laevis]|nr:hypothetical protein CF336_g8641 [Tilletia laevis]